VAVVEIFFTASNDLKSDLLDFELSISTPNGRLQPPSQALTVAQNTNGKALAANVGNHGAPF
jgi:hypothetical protein